MYQQASSARYANYERSSLVTRASSGPDDRATNHRHPPPLMANGHLTPPSSTGRSRGANAVKERLQNINSSMSWIREELVSSPSAAPRGFVLRVLS